MEAVKCMASIFEQSQNVSANVSALGAGQCVVSATACDEGEAPINPQTKKDLGKTKVSASQCTSIPISALAPPVGLEPTTNGLTVLSLIHISEPTRPY